MIVFQKIKKMKVAEIKSRYYDPTKDKWVLCALVKSGYKYGGYDYMYFLFNSEEEMYRIKEGDVVE